MTFLLPNRSVKMIDGSEKRNRQLAFELQNSHVCEKRSKKTCDALLVVCFKGASRGNLTKLLTLTVNVQHLILNC